MSTCREVRSTHNQLRAAMSPLFAGLKAAAQAREDAEDAAVDTMANLDGAEARIDLREAPGNAYRFGGQRRGAAPAVLDRERAEDRVPSR